VTGYRIDELNPWGGYRIVRERHAHAWSEVHLAGVGWLTVDPSPISGESLAAAERTPLWAGLSDYARVWLAAWGAELALGLLVLGLAAVQVRRIVRGRSASRARAHVAASAPPEGLRRLLEHLARAGFERGASESIEHLARRIAGRGGAAPGSPGAGSVPEEAHRYLLRYAALRYGDHGDRAGLRAEVDAWLAGPASQAVGGSSARPSARPSTPSATQSSAADAFSSKDSALKNIAD
jgi:hypothetical protein